MKPWIVHYMNKYPRGNVTPTEDSIDVTCAMGKNRVALRKNGAGQWVDESAKLGYLDRHCLSPIPRDARVWKLTREGEIQPDDQCVPRSAIQEELAAIGCGGQDRVPSIEELHKAVNPGVDVRNLDIRFEYATWSHRPRNSSVTPPPAPPQLDHKPVEPAAGAPGLFAAALALPAQMFNRS